MQQDNKQPISLKGFEGQTVQFFDPWELGRDADYFYLVRFVGSMTNYVIPSDNNHEDGYQEVTEDVFRTPEGERYRIIEGTPEYDDYQEDIDKHIIGECDRIRYHEDGFYYDTETIEVTQRVDRGDITFELAEVRPIR